MGWLPPIIPDTKEAEIRKISIRGQFWQKILQTPISTNKSRPQWHTPVIPVIQEV
jgi:hypothetical protein